MKTLEQLYEEIKSNEEVKKEFGDAFKEGKIDEFLKKQECDASVEDVMKYMNNLKSGAISDDDLDQVAGGGCTSLSCYDTCGCYTCDPTSCY